MDENFLTVSQLKSSEITDGYTFTAILVVRKITQRTTKTDNPFLSVELGDKTGSFSLICFVDQPSYNFFSEQGEGIVVAIEGTVEHYQGRFSPRLQNVKALSEEQLSQEAVQNLVETPPETPEQLKKDLDELIAFIKHSTLRATVQNVFEELGDKFLTLPAAVSMHHAYRFGLLEHTVHIGKNCRALLPLYPEVDADLAMAGGLLHDVGKALEYEGNLAFKKTTIGQLQGHVILGYRLTRKAAMKTKLSSDILDRLEHIILSHQGELEWGAAVMAATPEAVFISMVDNLDAKMGMVQRSLRQTSETEEFSEYMPGLKSPVFTLPPIYPDSDTDGQTELPIA